ncbi:hypothetical protein Sjap_005706 [Stephania japonica]|uniref:Uncharacterized protein n=1 Tax=Stephania japonica TaxID=461633 RepID=A0AAP0K650_9MAGN
MSRPSPRSPQQERRTIKDMEKDMISYWLSPSTKKYSFDGWSNSSYQQDTYSSMRNQPSRDIIRFLLDTEQDMNLTEQELDQWIEQRDQEAEEEINSILQKISAETMSAIPLESVEMNEATPIEDDWSEPEEIIEVSLHEPDISIAQNEANEAEKEIDVILERPEEPQKRSKEDQPLVLVTPPTLPCLPVKFMKGVVIKERSQIFYTADTFVSDDHDELIDSYVLEVPDELLHLKEGIYDELPKAIDAPFMVEFGFGEEREVEYSYSDDEEFISEEEIDGVIFVYSDAQRIDPIFFEEDFDNFNEEPKFGSDGYDFVEKNLVFGDAGLVIEVVSLFEVPQVLEEVVRDVGVNNDSLDLIAKAKVLKFATNDDVCVDGYLHDFSGQNNILFYLFMHVETSFDDFVLKAGNTREGTKIRERIFVNGGV